MRKPPLKNRHKVKLIRTYWEAYLACRRQWNSDDLNKTQLKRLERIINHSYEHVPFYRERFDSIGLKPNDIRTTDDLSKVPLLTKQDLKSHFKELTAKDLRIWECKLNRTSGSTGEPTVSLIDPEMIIYKMASILRAHQACGLSFGERFLNLTPGRPSHNWTGPIFNKWQSSWDLSWYGSVPIGDFLRALVDYNCTAIYGAASLIKELAMQVREKNYRIKPRLVLTSFEMLDIATRDYIAEVFQANVIDTYGCSEIGDIAWECPQHLGYHINSDTLIAEVLDGEQQASKGGVGEIVVTSLYNLGMPLIRYKTGDYATLDSEAYCSCGRKLPLLRNILGRKDDFIVLPNGRMVSPYVISGPVTNMAIRQFQIVQEELGRIEIRVVEGDTLTERQKDYIRRRYEVMFGSDVAFDIVRVDSIKRSESGKLRTVISKLRIADEITSPFAQV